jgi:hypothetical protein
MSEAPGDGPRDRGFRERKRDDHALVLIDQIRAGLDDLPLVRRLLLELGRYYDPILGGGVVDLPTQKAIMSALEDGRRAEAERLLDERYRLYLKDRVHLGPGGLGHDKDLAGGPGQTTPEAR